ncbi:MAG: MobA/MobL family protein [Oscillospiraceae bacterium]|nr:MobA/MobL family protein [Oscillospiraceae bacterium]
MAIYHLHVGIVSRRAGRSSVTAAAYRAGEKLKNDYDGATHDYINRNSISTAAYRAGAKLNEFDFTNKKGVVHSEIMLPENAPREYFNRSTLWNVVEKSEKRWDAQTARDIDVALPIEFKRQEQIEVMREYIQENFVDRGMCADFSIHDKLDGNPHAHILLTTREVSEKGFNGKNREWNKTQCLKQWRGNWADICNAKLRAKGIGERIDHRTLKAQGIDREPTIHMGAEATALECKGIFTERGNKNRDIIARNTAKHMYKLKQECLILDNEISALQKQIAEARQEELALRFEAEQIHERVEEIKNMKGRQYEQATNYFKRTYNITPQQAAVKIEKLGRTAQSKRNLQEKLQNKINVSVEEKKDSLKVQSVRENILLIQHTRERTQEYERIRYR